MAIKTQVNLSWDTINNSRAYFYEIHRSSTSGFTPDSSTLVDKIVGEQNTYTDEVENGTHYYKIRATNSFTKKDSSEFELAASCKTTDVVTTDVLSWPRSNGRVYEAGPDHASSDGWSLDTSETLLKQSENTTVVRNIYSPETYNDYTIELKIYSDATDDDWVGLVGAGKLIDGNITFLSFILGRDSNVEPSKSDWCAVFGDETNLGLGDEIKSAPIPTPVTSGWAGTYIYMRIVRVGDTITASVSDWNTDVIDPSTEITITPTDLPRKGDQLLTSASSYGFSTLSQANSYWEIM